jgi:hypothetical protein
MDAWMDRWMDGKEDGRHPSIPDLGKEKKWMRTIHDLWSTSERHDQEQAFYSPLGMYSSKFASKSCTSSKIYSEGH